MPEYGKYYSLNRRLEEQFDNSREENERTPNELNFNLDKLEKRKQDIKISDLLE